jgi:hypothetical protein
MQSIYHNIDQLIKYRDKCIFCQTKLKTILTNHINFKNVPTLSSKFKADQFEFSLTYNAANMDFQVDLRLDAVNNFLVFDKPIVSEHYEKGLCEYFHVFEQVIRTFNDLRIHTETYCPSRKCGLKYYFSSINFYIWNATELPDKKCLIPHIQLSDECFNVGNYWVQNTIYDDKTNIYSTKHPDKDPIIQDLIDFSSLDKDKLLNKIKMLITFS